MKLELLKVGHCYHSERVAVKSGSWKPTAFPAIVGLIKHPSKGYILFDTGYSDHFICATQPFPERLYRWLTPMHLPCSEQLVRQLNARNIGTDDISYIFISHFHADHIAGLRDFPKATYICSKFALANIMQSSRWSNLLHGQLPSLLPLDFSKRAVFIEDQPSVQLSINPSNLSPFETAYDLLGDGALLAIALPGHAYGHYGLMSFHNSKVSFLIGDACWSIKTITEGLKPHPISRLILSDTNEYYRTLDKLSRLHSSSTEIELLPSHCKLSYEAFRAQQT